MRVGGVAEKADTSIESMDAALDSYGSKTGTRLQRSNGTCVRMSISREIMLLLVDQHVDALDARELTRAEINGRVLARHYLEAFKGTLAGWDGAFLASTGPQIGIRESRRMIGLEAVSASDVIEARQRPEEAIARCGWPMEDHAVPGETSYSQIRDHKWYHIPYGAITSRNIGNLWTGGQLVSADNRAFASLRVMGTAFATGHGAGLAAAAHAENGRVDITKLRAALSEQGALV